MEPLAKRLRQARMAAELSQEKLGIQAGIDEFSASARMNQYERGKHTPDFGTLARIAKVLKVPVSYFYAISNDEADMLVKYHRLPKAKQAKVAAFIEELAS